MTGQTLIADVRVGPYITTYTGRNFYPQDIRPGDINIEDIAYSLAGQQRWTAHCSPRYSVADHAINCCILARLRFGHAAKVLQLLALHHDSEETYTVDLSRPFKHMPGMESFVAMGDTIRGAIFKEFIKWDGPLPPEIKKIDDEMLVLEARLLMGNPPWCHGLPEPKEVSSFHYGRQLVHDYPEDTFLTIHRKLTKELEGVYVL